METTRCSRICALLALLSVGVVSCAPPSIPVPANPGMGVILHQDTYDYEVTGTSVRELRLSMARNARNQLDHTTFGGFTAGNLHWAYARSQSTLGGCRPIGVQVYLDLSVRYPAWNDSAAAPASVRDEWIRFVTALKAHEGNHAAIDIRGANKLASGLRDLISPFCTNLQADAQRLATSVMQWIKTENEAYDARTRHGATEGASLTERVP